MPNASRDHAHEKAIEIAAKENNGELPKGSTKKFIKQANAGAGKGAGTSSSGKAAKGKAACAPKRGGR